MDTQMWASVYTRPTGQLVYWNSKTPKISVGMSSFWDQSELHNQYFASFAVSLGGLAVGASVGWSSPAQEFLATKSFLEFSWISGSLWLGFALPVGLLAHHYGRKLILLLNVGLLNLETGATKSDSLLCCMCFGLSMLLGILIAIGLLNVMEPRVLLILSSTLVLMLTAGLGVHCKLRRIEDPFLGHVTWLSVLGLCVFNFSRSLGFGSFSFYLMSKLLRPEVRNLGCGLIYSMSGIFGFINVKFFPNFIMTWGQPMLFFFYTGVGVLGLLFIYIMAPEIRNRTVMELQMNKSTVQDPVGEPVVAVKRK
ncbi:facilitated trehalose transporter Tret1-2 homolog [Drosophila tropicalis]|uniref:facilitated trehalose transporter Tret1-2 homolog n=1 Tax=Drosophila tropicalis TaxID=46794 RepID=UPI0035AC25D8